MFVRNIFSSDRIVEKLDRLAKAFKGERMLQKYFYDSEDTFMHCKKESDHLTRMNKFNWEDESYSYIKEIEKIPEHKHEDGVCPEKYLTNVKNFKTRHKKLLNKISKKLDLVNWHSCLKVGRIDLLARCINPIVKYPEQNREVILRRHVFKQLYKYASLAFNRNLLVKEIPSQDEGKLMFLRPNWITPNFCIVYVGFYNVEALERHDYILKLESLFTNKDMISKNLTYIVYQNRVSSLLVSLPCDIMEKQQRQKDKEKDKKNLVTMLTNDSRQKVDSDIEKPKDIPNYLYVTPYMSVFTFVPYKSVRLANNYFKKWIWIKDNKKIIADFIKVISRHRICEGFELVHTCNDDLLFIKAIKVEKRIHDHEAISEPSLVQYLIKHDKNNPTYVKTEVYLEKENGHYSIKQKKFSKRKNKKSKSITYNEKDFFQQLCNYFTGIDKFLFTNICTYHNLLMNALDITTEICYFRGMLSEEYKDVIRSHQDEQQIKLKILIMKADIRKYMKNSYPKLDLPYNKEDEKKPISQLGTYNDNEFSEEFGIDTENDYVEECEAHSGCNCHPQGISGENIDFSIDLLLDNSDNLGEHRFNVPDMPESLIGNNEFANKFYGDFYNRLLKIFEDFSNYQVNSQKYKKEDMIFVKLICKDQLFVIKINTFEEFYRKSIKYIKTGRDVFIKATYYQINNVMLGLKYNEKESILHDLNPNYAITHEWTKDYFDIDENVHIDYSDFGLDYYFEEDDDEWLTLEKSVDNIIKNFQLYLNSCYDIVFSEFALKLVRDNYRGTSSDFKKAKKNTYCCSFKLNITDLVLLGLDLKRFPPYDSKTEEFKYVDMNESGTKTKDSEYDTTMYRNSSEKMPPLVSLQSKTSPMSIFEKTPNLNEKNRNDSIDYNETEQTFQDTLSKNYEANDSVAYYFCKLPKKNSSQKKGKIEGEKEEAQQRAVKDYLSNDPLIFYSLDVMYAEKNQAKRKPVHGYGSIFDRVLIKDFICSVDYVKEQTNQKLAVNKSEGYIDPGIGVSLSECVIGQNESFDN